MTFKAQTETVLTGWNNGLSQDYNKGLGRWFADRLGAREQLRRDIAANVLAKTGEDDGRPNNSGGRATS